MMVWSPDMTEMVLLSLFTASQWPLCWFSSGRKPSIEVVAGFAEEGAVLERTIIPLSFQPFVSNAAALGLFADKTEQPLSTATDKRIVNLFLIRFILLIAPKVDIHSGSNTVRHLSSQEGNAGFLR